MQNTVQTLMQSGTVFCPMNSGIHLDFCVRKHIVVSCKHILGSTILVHLLTFKLHLDECSFDEHVDV